MINNCTADCTCSAPQKHLQGVRFKSSIAPALTYQESIKQEHCTCQQNPASSPAGAAAAATAVAVAGVMSGQEEEAPELLRSWTDGSTSEVSHEFINNSDVTLQLIWTDFDGVEKVYANIEPSTALTQGTYSTHAWCLRTEDGNLLIEFAGPAAQITILPDGSPRVVVQPPPPPPAATQPGAQPGA